MSVRHINKKRVIAGTAIAVPLGIIAAGAASAAIQAAATTANT